MDKKLVEEIKKKKEFSQLPDSVVERVVERTKGDVKESRALLRKYIGVFLTNKILKGKLDAEEILEKHISSKGRDYSKLYGQIFDLGGLAPLDPPKTIVDFGCGVNGFSYKHLKGILGAVKYVGLEAAGQLVQQMNDYFDKEKFNALAEQADLFDVKKMGGFLEKQEKPRAVFLFQVVDALESLEKDFSKKFLLVIKDKCEKIVLSYSLKSLSGREVFQARRKWLLDFIEENFVIEKTFEMGNERFLIIKNKK